jgi:hypothetical protein
MKSIDTLIEDIHGLFTQGKFEPEFGAVETFTTKLVERIGNRFREERGPPKLRLSVLGTPCSRKLWYSINTPEKGEELPPTAQIKFLFGDILEELLLVLARLSGHIVENEQKEVDLEGVKGHIDGKIDGVLVDCKSASSRSYDKFASHTLASEDTFGYITQLDAYLHADSSDDGAFLAIDKQLGKICLDKHPKSSVDYKSKVQATREMLAQSEPPERPYVAEPDGKSGNMKLGVACSYCLFKNTCWPGLRTFLYSNGPRYLTVVQRLPEVPELHG